jgi:hypothetical protein
MLSDEIYVTGSLTQVELFMLNNNTKYEYYREMSISTFNFYIKLSIIGHLNEPANSANVES